MLENVVLITGASRRVGLYLAKQFLQTYDYPVVVTYQTHRESIVQLEKMGAHCFQVDLTDQQALQGFIENCQQQIASVRVLIHNASIWAKDQAILESPELFNKMFQLHQQVPWRLTNALAPQLQKCSEEKADVISITDNYIHAGSADYGAYLSTKAGLQNLTKSFAKQLAPKVQVNDIAPGLLLFHPHDTQDYKQQRLARQLLPKEPGEGVIWQAVEFLMNNAYTTGMSLPVDGGVLLASR